jgi:hypothetical protein
MDQVNLIGRTLLENGSAPINGKGAGHILNGQQLF